MTQENNTPPSNDLQMESRRSLRFYVFEKSKQGGPWREILRTNELGMAFAHAQECQAFEAGIFVQTPSGGLLYWTSASPDLFNSTVLKEGYS